MKDKYGREIDYLRISLTTSCNLRCIYCMPELLEKESNISNEKLLTKDEIIKITDIFSKIGIKKIRLTGGEPLLREEINEIIAGLNKIEGIKEICLTTNGILLEKNIEELKKNGLTRVNISLDTVDEDEYFKITRGGNLKTVLKGIEKAIELGIKVKINTVLIDSPKNQKNILDIVKLSLNENIDVRFIELMPIGVAKNLKKVNAEKVIEILSKEYELENLEHFEGTSRYYKIKNSTGRIGFINPISQCFCESCNRVRITSQGGLKNCLSSKMEVNIIELLRENISLDEIRDIIEKNIFNRNEKSIFEEKEQSVQKKMNEIGG